MNSNLPLVSVGIPTYNRPIGLRRTLNCISTQTYANLEIIVSDNFSENVEVAQVIEEFCKKDRRIISIRQKENIGAIDNFKFLLNKASGKYFMWAADDDEWDRSYVSVCLKELLKEKNYGFAFSNYILKSRCSFLLNKRCKVDFTFVELYNRNERVLNYTNLRETTHKANMIYGVWKKEILSRMFTEIDKLKFDKSNNNLGIDNLMLIVGLGQTRGKWINKSVFFKYYDNLIPGSKLNKFVDWKNYFNRTHRNNSLMFLRNSYEIHFDLLENLLLNIGFNNDYIEYLLKVKKEMIKGNRF